MPDIAALHSLYKSKPPELAHNELKQYLCKYENSLKYFKKYNI